MTHDEGSEALVVLRAGDWRCSIPLRNVDRVLSAAAPVAIPSGDDRINLSVRLGEELIPVVFIEGLFGVEEPLLHLTDKMVVTTSAHGRCVLWVSSVEDVIAFVPLGDQRPAAAMASDWVACFCGGTEALAVLDIEKLVADRRS